MNWIYYINIQSVKPGLYLVYYEKTNSYFIAVRPVSHNKFVSDKLNISLPTYPPTRYLKID